MKAFWTAVVMAILGALAPAPVPACVGKTLVVAAPATAEGRVVAQVIAILINERTGTTVKLAEVTDAEAAHRALVDREVDIAVEYAGEALARVGLPDPGDPVERVAAVKAAYLERLNLVWLPPLGFGGHGNGPAAPVARKDTLKKFPALPRLIAKTRDRLPDHVVAALARADDPARAAREFLRRQKLI